MCFVFIFVETINVATSCGLGVCILIISSYRMCGMMNYTLVKGGSMGN